MLTREIKLRSVGTRHPGIWLQVGSLVLPIVKCAFCPVCLGLLGTALAGARLGFLRDEHFHGVLIALAVIVDIAILRVGRQHHHRPGPLALCAVGALVSFAGHLSEMGTMETTGFAGLMVAGVWNFVLLRRHRHTHGACCQETRTP